MTDGAVAVPVPDARVAGYCRALHQVLPSKVDGLAREDPEPRLRPDRRLGKSGHRTALRGAEPAADVERTTRTPTAVDVDGVGWLIEQRPDGTCRLTTTLRKAYVEVTLPKKYAGDIGPLTDLAAAVKKAIPVALTPRPGPVRCRARGGSAQAGGAAQRRLDQQVDQFRVARPRSPATSAGTSRSG